MMGNLVSAPRVQAPKLLFRFRDRGWHIDRSLLCREKSATDKMTTALSIATDRMKSIL